VSSPAAAPALGPGWWVPAISDIAIGLGAQLTAMFLFQVNTLDGTRSPWTLVPLMLVFFAGFFYVGRGVRKLRRATKADSA